MPISQQSYTDRLTQAIVFKATRFYLMAQAPFGHWGEMTEEGLAMIRPDYEVRELLYGMRFKPVGELESLVDTDLVIRQGLQQDPDDFPADKVPDVERAIGAACSWVEDFLTEGIAIA